MTEIVPSEEFIQKNYNKTIELVEKTNNPNLKKLIEDLGERYATAPASSHSNYYSAFPGGLCYHALHVLTWVSKFANVMAPQEFSGECLLKISLLHSIGKVGDAKQDLYLRAEEWQHKNGTRFNINKDLSYMRIPQRSLYLASLYGISLTEDEYMAILLSEGHYDNANSSYKYSESKLALILHYASRWAQQIEKNNIVHWPSNRS